MISLKANDIEFEFPQRWGEVTFEQWKLIEGQDDPLQILNAFCPFKVTPSIANQLQPFVSWMEMPFIESDWVMPDKIMVCTDHAQGIWEERSTKIDIRHKLFGQKVILEQMNGKDIDKVVALYYFPAFTDGEFDYEKTMLALPEVHRLNLSEVYSLSKNIYQQLLKIKEREKKELKSEVSSEALRAGINMFDRFGVENIVDSLAQGKVWLYNTIYNMEYNVIFDKLVRNKLEGKYRSNYQKIIKDSK